MRRILLPALLGATALLTACGAAAGTGGGQGSPQRAPAPVPNITARAEMRDAEGRALGTFTLTQTPSGVLLSGEMSNLPAGVHAIHYHDVGRCDPPFTSAGGHMNATQRLHGFRNPGGPHVGDLENFSSPSAGATRIDRMSGLVTLVPGVNTLLDTDGTSVIIHAGADDYLSDPAGGSGARIACGVVTR